jgi:hypothetical protein
VLRKFYRKILGRTELLIGCHSIPLWSDRDLVALFDTLVFECECLLFPTDVELYDPICNINRGFGWYSRWMSVVRYRSFLGGHSRIPRSPQARKNSRFSPGYLLLFPLKARSIDPLAADAGK